MADQGPKPAHPPRGKLLVDAEEPTGTLATGVVKPTRRERVIQPGTRIGRYIALEPLGRGGMGLVCKGYDPHLSRHLAIKLLRLHGPAGSTEGDVARERLVREAQALAQLSHPNVVAVYDAGTVGDDVFVAMEFIEGKTLRRWLTQARPRVSEILGVFAEAGAGLHAAHLAGIVHRDFKPTNAIIGDDGRVRVLDFGIAQYMSQDDRPDSSDDSSTNPPGRSSLGLDESFESAGTGPLTHAGSVMGTPNYMAPEQHLRNPVDARTDQFSFCVALYEALYGRRPFPGRNLRAIRERVLDGPAPDLPRDRDVPRRIRRALLRGLSRAPDDRFHSMTELVDELRRDQRGRRRMLGAGAAGAAVAGVAALAVLAGPGETRCRDAATHVAGVWDEQARERVRAGITSAGLVYAADVHSRTADHLERFFAEWVDVRNDACAATHLRGEQSGELLDLRMRCLNRKLTQMSDLVGLLGASPGQDLIARAVQAASDLGDLAPCSDPATLRDAIARPTDAALRARIDEAYARMDQIDLMTRTGDLKTAATFASELVADARRLDYAPLLARALVRLGGLQTRLGPFEDAAATIREALRQGARARDAPLIAASWIKLMEVVGRRLERVDAALALRDAAEVAIAFLDAPRKARADLDIEVGLLHTRAGNADVGRVSLERGVQALAAELGSKHRKVAMAQASLGLALMEHGQYAPAEVHLSRAIDTMTELLGPLHPDLSVPLTNLASVLTHQRKHASAEAMFRRALAIDEATLGPNHPWVAENMTNLGGALLAQDKRGEARHYLQEALSRQERRLGPNHPDVAWTLTGVAEAIAASGDHAAAQRHLLRALDITTAQRGPEHTDVAKVHHHLGVVRGMAGDVAGARSSLEKAIQIFEQQLGVDHARVAPALVELARVQLAAGQAGRAARGLERALAIQARADVAVADTTIAETRLLLARALWTTAESRERARSVANLAATSLRVAGHSGKLLTDIERWLAQHPP